MDGNWKAFLAPSEAGWSSSQPLNQKNLLRLSILRDLSRLLHAKRSHLLASQSSIPIALPFQTAQERLEALSPEDLQSQTIEELLTSKPPSSSKRNFPKPSLYMRLGDSISHQKLERYDRKWELFITYEALKLGWEFWSVEAWILVQQADSFHKKFQHSLWPNGVFLFVESADTGADPKKPDRNLWKGRWIFVLDPQVQPFKLQQELLDPALHGPTPPALHRLFSGENA